MSQSDNVWPHRHGLYGQLGLGEGEDVHEPTCVDVLTGCRVGYISAGRQHSGALGDTLYGKHLGASMDRPAPHRPSARPF